MIITGNFGRYLGIPFLFLDPEYLFEVSFSSFFIMGFVVAGFTIAFHITTYITDGARFPFLGTLPKPFTHFILNNSIIPFIFLVVYILEIIEFQTHYEFATTSRIAWYLTGLLLGYLVMLISMFVYFRFTNKDIFKYVAK
ncbi:MAG: patatin-like phospholipase family protein, partial [Bacteroidetes bacterium]|nr:patatin-like phospholipase family protein [Bacteroidota bacterium]